MIVLGKNPDAPKDPASEAPPQVGLKLNSLLRHVAVVGSSGSGKTVTCKVLCEELALQGIPIIAIDPQGDIASLGIPGDPKQVEKKGGDPANVDRWGDEVEVVTWTPVSSAGVPISVNPLNIRLDEEADDLERARAISLVAQNVTQLLGYETDKKDGRSVSALVDMVLAYAVQTGWKINALGDLADAIKEMPEHLAERANDLITDRRREEVVRQLRTLTIGARRLLFAHGAPLDIDTLIGREGSGAEPPFMPKKPAESGDDADAGDGAGESQRTRGGTTSRKRKTRVSVIYLNTLQSQEEKAFFVAELAGALYRWMLANPSSEPQLAFYIDEIAPFLPPTRKPASRDILRLLFKQARKYGVTCLMATQNVGDVDYKSMAQFATMLLGRLTTKQDIEKVQHLVEALAPHRTAEVLDALPKLKAGGFRVVSPDNYADPQPLQVRWLYTAHKTLDEESLDEVVTDEMRKRLANASPKKKGRRAINNAAPLTTDTEQVDTRGRTGDETRDRAAADRAAKSARYHIEQLSRPDDSMDDEDIELENTEYLSMAEAVTDPDITPAARPSGGPPRTPNVPAARGSAYSTPTSPGGGSTGAGATEFASAVTAAEPNSAAESARMLADQHELSDRQQEVLAFLLEKPRQLQQSEIADRFPYSKSVIAKELRALEDAGLVTRSRDGNKHLFQASEHPYSEAFGFLETLPIAVLQVSEATAHQAGNRAIPGGMFGRQGEVTSTVLRYFPMWRCRFQGTRSKKLLGFIKWGSETVQEAVYMHPTDDKICLLTNGGLAFHEAPHQNPAEIQDLDGHVTWQTGHVEPLQFFDELAPRLLDRADVARHFMHKFLDHKVQPDEIDLCFLPVWRATWQSYKSDARRTLHIDGILGQPFEY